MDDTDWSERNAALLRALHNKDTCGELFRDLLHHLGEIERKRIDLKQFFKSKVTREDLIMNYKVLNMCVKLRGLKNIAYLKAILARIDFSRQLFMMDI